MKNIEQQVMASVGVIYTARRLTSMTAFKAYALAVSFAGIAAFVSVSNVMQNFASVLQSGGVDRILNYVLVAVTQTTLPVQLALLMGTMALLSLAVEMVRSVTQPRYV